MRDRCDSPRLGRREGRATIPDPALLGVSQIYPPTTRLQLAEGTQAFLAGHLERHMVHRARCKDGVEPTAKRIERQIIIYQEGSYLKAFQRCHPFDHLQVVRGDVSEGPARTLSDEAETVQPHVEPSSSTWRPAKKS